MPEGGKITYKQFIFIIFIGRIAITITTLPALSAPPANQDVWLSELLSFPIMLLFLIPIYLLWKRFPGKTIIQCGLEVMGKGGIFVGILYIWLFIHITSLSLAQFSEFMASTVLPETPLVFFLITMMLVCAYAVYNGMEVMGRMAEIVAPITMLAIILINILLFRDMRIEALTPIMEKGFFITLHGGFTVASRTNELITFAVFLPCLNDGKKAKRVIIASSAVMVVFFVLITIPILTVFGGEEAKNQVYPFFRVVRMINIGNFLERVEIVHVAIWLLGICIKISLFYYLSVLGISQLFGLKDYKPFILPVGTVVIPLCIAIAPNIAVLLEFLSYKIYTWYSLFFLLLLPLILLILAMIRKKGMRKKERNEKPDC